MKRIAATALMMMAIGPGGCAAVRNDRPIAEAGGGLATACTASRAEAFVGQSGERIAERARIAAGATAVRMIRPGSAVTMDYRADRLNLKLDDKGNVTSVNCG